jgi:hypothetical protein
MEDIRKIDEVEHKKIITLILWPGCRRCYHAEQDAGLLPHAKPRDGIGSRISEGASLLLDGMAV